VLKQWGKEGKQWDVVMLDPPRLPKSARIFRKPSPAIRKSTRGMKLIKPGGFPRHLLLHNLVSPDLFLDIIDMAAKECPQKAAPGGLAAQSADHPILRGIGKHAITLNFLLYR